MKAKCLAAALVALSLMMTACGAAGGEASATATPEATATASPTAEPTAEPTATPVPLKTIGTKAESATAVEIELHNATGAEIKVITLQADGVEMDAVNLLGENDAFAKDEKRVLYFEPKADTDYRMELTTADGTVLTLNDFPLTDAKAAAIKISDGTAYLEYTSEATKKAVNTLEAEKALSAPAAIEENAPKEVEYTEPEYTEPEYQEPEYTEPEYSEPEYTEPEPPAGNGGDGEGCLDDALFN